MTIAKAIDVIGPTQSDIQRFWTKVQKESECWQWIGLKSTGGYGRFGYGKKVFQAHRVSYELLIGQIPIGLCIDHLCRNRACVNPAHLEPVTNRENLMRGPTTIPAMCAAKTHCPHGHPYSPDNTIIKATGERKCKQCNRVQFHSWKAKKKANGLQNNSCA